MTRTAKAFPTPPQKPKITPSKIVGTLIGAFLAATLAWIIMFAGMYAVGVLIVNRGVDEAIYASSLCAALVFATCFLYGIFTDEEHEKAKRKYQEDVWLHHMTAAGFTKEQAMVMRFIRPPLDP